MFSKIRKHVTYANATVTLALVFAMSSGAYAANKYLISSTKQISPKVLKALQGKTGAAGKAGSQGIQGATGPAGPAGATGPKGENGAPALEGKEGKEGKAGKEGKEGKQGAPWTAGGTLPTGATETGQWTEAQGVASSTGKIQLDFASISFAVPLVKELESGNVHFIKPGETPPTGCKGSVEKPEAESGNLCVFASVLTEKTLLGPTFINAEHESTANAGKTGTIMQFVLPENEENAASARGTWAVTA